MAFSRFKDAVSDVAETLRQVIRNPQCHAVPVGLHGTEFRVTALLETRVLGVSLEPEVRVQTFTSLTPPPLVQEPMDLAARIQSERAWNAWTLGVPSAGIPVFPVGRALSAAVQPLPQNPASRRHHAPLVAPAIRRLETSLGLPRSRKVPAELEAPRARQGLAMMLGLPVSISGTAWQSLNKVVALRYSAQIVKQTGENIRNLDVLGVFPIPVRGVRELRHDARQNLLVLRLDTEAYGAERRQFILARRKADQSLVSCFLEEC